jgi:hypothetical protein
MALNAAMGESYNGRTFYPTANKLVLYSTFNLHPPYFCESSQKLFSIFSSRCLACMQLYIATSVEFWP